MQSSPSIFAITLNTCARKMVEQQAQHDVMKTMPKSSWFRWACDDPDALAKWVPGLELLRSESFADLPRELVPYVPLIYRVMMKIAPGYFQRLAGGYRLNQFRLPGAERT